jgi:pimeloyl-ACP methyl ester carboxylesterase
MAIYVLVHGGGHGGWCYKRVSPFLRNAGHEVYTPTLTGLGERSHLLSPGVTLDTHIMDVVELLHYEDLFDVILVGHSYGGMIITGVADRALSRIGHLVYLDASHPRDGESLADLAPSLLGVARESGRVVDGVELFLFPGTEPLGYFGVTDPEAIAWVQPRLTPHPWRTFEQPLRLVNQAAIDRLPRTNINCTPLLAAREKEGHLDRLSQGDNVWEIDTGHDLMITEPDAVAEMLLRLAAE